MTENNIDILDSFDLDHQMNGELDHDVQMSEHKKGHKIKNIIG